VHRHKANRAFVIGIDIKPTGRDDIALFINHHLVMRHGVPGVALGALRLVQRLA